MKFNSGMSGNIKEYDESPAKSTTGDIACAGDSPGKKRVACNSIN